MHRLLVLAGLASLALAPPLVAQQSEVTLGFFVRVSAENVPDFEEAAAEHAQWHADQNDTQTWAAYQALTGPQSEYAFLAGMAWAALDNPSLDMGADVAHWASEVAPFTQSEEAMMWSPCRTPATHPRTARSIRSSRSSSSSSCPGATRH